MMRISLTAGLAAALLASTVACSEDAAPKPPDEEAIRQALTEYFERRQTAGAIVERHTRPSEPAPEEEDEETQDGEQASQPCPRFEFRYMDRDGEWRQGSYRLPCEIMDKAESEVSRALEEMAKALSEMSERARREIRDFVATDIAEVERLGCVPAESKPGFVCDIEATFVYGEDREETRFLTARFVESESGWRALEIEEHV